ncbi:MAG: hypothetical protein II992_07100 [Lachnospiraceae bacterium]|nr:hypothetical protein [Lachnospiraceae bacterium]
MIVRSYNNGLDDGIWVKGYLRCDCGMWLIYQFEYDRADQVAYEVNPETICQYTGLKDKNSKKIWENDIVKDSRGNLYKVFWQENYYQFAFICIKANDALLFGAKWDLWSLAKNKDLELQGSIFDNPELLKEGIEE